jgi:hypothetical protein
VAARVATSLLSHHPSAGFPNPLGLAGAMASQMAAMVVTLSPHGDPSWLSVEPLCLAISGSGRCFLLYWCAPWFCRWRPWVRSSLRCEVSRGSGGGGFFLPAVARLQCRVLVGALWRVEGVPCESTQGCVSAL